jgi:hypothetical protein
LIWVLPVIDGRRITAEMEMRIRNSITSKVVENP